MRKPPKEVSDWLAKIGRKGGQIGGRSKSKAKIAAARRNAKLGGRPRKGTKREVHFMRESAPPTTARMSTCNFVSFRNMPIGAVLKSSKSTLTRFRARRIPDQLSTDLWTMPANGSLTPWSSGN
jgi:hypothetical protein